VSIKKQEIMAHISKVYSKILAVLMACIGFAAIPVSCAKYGAPMATYKTKGVVVSETNDIPIEGIRAVLKGQPDDTREMDAVYTDSKGVFNLTIHEGYDNMLYVELKDVDGEKNGSFNDTTVVADFSHVQFKGTVRYDSEVEKDLGIIKIRPKK
jgi:putative lipoprotein (rSAM/lipoprotein system)